MKPWLSWVIGIALVVTAWTVAVFTPPEEAAVAPFVTTTEIGDAAVGRNIAVTITAVHRAESVTAGSWSADGNWLVIELDAAAVVTESPGSLQMAKLEVGGLTIQASERPESLFKSPLAVGIAHSGSLAFELPPDVTSGRATLLLGTNSDPRLDSLIQLDIELNSVDLQPTVEMAATEWSSR